MISKSPIVDTKKTNNPQVANDSCRKEVPTICFNHVDKEILLGASQYFRSHTLSIVHLITLH